MKLGELATVRSGLVLSRKQAHKGAPIKMRYPLLSFRAIHPNGYIDMEQLDDIFAGKEPRPPKDWVPRTTKSSDDGNSSGGGTPAVDTDPSPTAA